MRPLYLLAILYPRTRSMIVLVLIARHRHRRHRAHRGAPGLGVALAAGAHMRAGAILGALPRILRLSEMTVTVFLRLL
jgi:hypothetical protein